MIASTVSSLTIPFISGLLKKIGEKSAEKAISKAGEVIRSINIYQTLSDSSSNKKYTENLLKKVFTFRTILSGDKDVYLDQIYYPLNVSSYKRKNIIIDDYESLEQEQRVCLVGVAGQGKTMTMKKMFLEDLNKSLFFPIFLSFRNLDFSKELSLVEALEAHFITNGVDCSKTDVSALLKNNPVRLYLDGFDEIPVSHRKRAIKFLDECDMQWNCSVICSTRPDTEFCKLPAYTTYKVEYLKELDVRNIIHRNITNINSVKQLNKMLDEKKFLHESIITPILVDIFIVTCFGLGRDPENVTSYYDALFSSLAYKHDYHKIFSRERLSTLNDIQLENCFIYFSFMSHLDQKTTLDRNTCLSIFKESLEFINKETENEYDVMMDIINLTNLLVSDGYDAYTFIHKSIQDYYAARFLTKRPDDEQIEFWSEASCFYERNFCYMCKCLNEIGYYNDYVSNILNTSKKLSKNGVVAYVNFEEVKSVLADVSINFDVNNFQNMTFKLLREEDKYNEIEIIESIYNRVIFSKRFIPPYDFLFSFCLDNNDMIKERLSISSNKKHLSRATSYFLDIHTEEFFKVFPEIVTATEKYTSYINNSLDLLFKEYENHMALGLTQSKSAMRLIKNRARKRSG